MTDWCRESLDSPEVKCAYLAVVLVLVVLVFMHVWKIGYHFNERFQQPAYVYSSTRLAHVNSCDTLSSANQGDPSSCMSEVANGSLEDPALAAKNERLSATRGSADLWAVGHDMAAYKAAVTGQTPGLDPNRQGMRMELMTSENQSNPADDMYERLLHEQALIGA